MSRPVDLKRVFGIQHLMQEMIDQIEMDEFTGAVPALPSFARNHKFAASAQVAKYVTGRDFGTLNTRELKAIESMLAFVAHNQNTRQETVEAIVETNFNVHHVSKLKQQDYEDVIRFLVDLRVDDKRH